MGGFQPHRSSGSAVRLAFPSWGRLLSRSSRLQSTMQQYKQHTVGMERLRSWHDDASGTSKVKCEWEESSQPPCDQELR